MKNLFIIGDSYSTYGGYIPEGYQAYYGTNRPDSPVVNGVEKTWWRIFAKENDINIVMNDSYSGSTVCNTVRENYEISSSFISRIDKYIAEGFFEEHDIDTMIVFGGTNDSWIDAPIGKVQYANWSGEDLKSALPAFCYLIEKAKSVAKEPIVVINSDLKEEITNGFMAACEKNRVKYLCLKEIDKYNGHPTELGMEQIAKQVTACLNR